MALNDSELRTVKDAKLFLEAWQQNAPVKSNKVAQIIMELDAMIRHDEWLEKMVANTGTYKSRDPVVGD